MLLRPVNLSSAVQEASSREEPLALVTVFFGANDAVLPHRSSKKQYVPLEEYRQNLVKIVTAAQVSLLRGGGHS